MRLDLVQFNPTVGDIRTNADRIIEGYAQAAGDAADLVIYPELALCGYPPRDLLLQEGFVEECDQQSRRIAAATGSSTLVVGAPRQASPESGGGARRLANSLLVMRDHRIERIYDKRLLPTYDVFDEDRYFEPGREAVVLEIAGHRVGLSICEDLWRGADALHAERYHDRSDPVEALMSAGVDLIVNPSGSPFVIGKGDRQRDIVRRHVMRHNVAVATVNQVGGNDDQIFDGHAAVFVPGADGPRLVAAGPGFEEAHVVCDLPAERADWGSMPTVADPRVDAARESLLFRALVLGVRDYCRKTGFSQVVIGLSGGIDSALTCCIATSALGPDNVLGVAMPSRFSSPGSVDDARALAQSLGIRFEIVPIEGPHGAMERTLAEPFAHQGYVCDPGVTEENIQSRLRGLILMALSNKAGSLLLTTGNKSELAVGYCTLYGDMNGGLAVLSDVTKIDVYAISRWINSSHREAGFRTPPVPASSLCKPPSAELRPDQLDQDTLPPYEILDQVVERYVEWRQHPSTIARETRLDHDLVSRLARMIDQSEYKRIQLPVGLKVSRITFGPGRRHPIAQRYRPESSPD